MALFNGWPWAQFQEQNLDWLIKTVKELTDSFKQVSDDFTDLKEYVDNYFSELNVSQELRDIIQEMIDDGSLLALIQAYINTDYLTPDQFKTSTNTWDQAFELAVLADKPVLIPNKTYTLNIPHYFNADNIIADEGDYTKYGIIKTGNLPEVKNPYAWRMMKQPSAADGFTTSNGSQSWGYNEDKDCWIFADVHNNSDLHLVEYKKDFSEPLNDWSIGTYPDIHGGSVTYCHDMGFYIVAGSQTNQVWKVDPNTGSVQTIVLSSPGNIYITFFEYDRTNKLFYAMDQVRKRIHIYDVNLNYLMTKAFDTDLDFLPSGGTWQQIFIIDGILYGLASINQTGDNWGYAIMTIDLQHGNMQIVYSKYFDYPGFVLEAEGAAYDGSNLIIIGANGPIDFIDCFGVYRSILSVSDTEYYADETLTVNGDGSSASPFNIANAAIYAAYKNNQRPKSIISNLARSLRIVNLNNTILDFQTANNPTLNFERCNNITINGTGNYTAISFISCFFQIVSFTGVFPANYALAVQTSSFGAIRESQITGANPVVRIRHGSLVVFYNNTTTDARMAQSLNGGTIIDAGYNTAASGTPFYGEKIL